MPHLAQGACDLRRHVGLRIVQLAHECVGRLFRADAAQRLGSLLADIEGRVIQFLDQVPHRHGRPFLAEVPRRLRPPETGDRRSHQVDIGHHAQGIAGQQARHGGTDRRFVLPAGDGQEQR